MIGVVGLVVVESILTISNFPHPVFFLLPKLTMFFCLSHSLPKPSLPKPFFFSLFCTSSIISLAISTAAVESAQALIRRQTTFSAENVEGFISVDYSYGSDAEDGGRVYFPELEDLSWSFFSAAGSPAEYTQVIIEAGERVFDSGGSIGFKFNVAEDRLDKFNGHMGVATLLLSYPSAPSLAIKYVSDDASFFNVPSGGEMIFDIQREFLLPAEVNQGHQSTPEPSLMLGFITLGGVLLGSKRKTKS